MPDSSVIRHNMNMTNVTPSQTFPAPGFMIYFR